MDVGAVKDAANLDAIDTPSVKPGFRRPRRDTATTTAARPYFQRVPTSAPRVKIDSPRYDERHPAGDRGQVRRGREGVRRVRVHDVDVLDSESAVRSGEGALRGSASKRRHARRPPPAPPRSLVGQAVHRGRAATSTRARAWRKLPQPARAPGVRLRASPARYRCEECEGNGAQSPPGADPRRSLVDGRDRPPPASSSYPRQPWRSRVCVGARAAAARGISRRATSMSGVSVRCRSPGWCRTWRGLSPPIRFGPCRGPGPPR